MRKKKVYPLFLWMVIAVFISTAYAEENNPPQLLFKMTQGQGTKVCDVYLQRLNTTALLKNQYPFGNQLSGLREVTKPLKKDFDDLNSIALSEEEIQRLYFKINSFNSYRDQYLLEKYSELHKNNWFAKEFEGEKEKLPERIKGYIANHQDNPFVRYQKKLDMDNDGSATDTVIENHYSVYIVDENLQRIDAAKMMAIFADQELLEWPTIAQFPPLTMVSNVFKHQGKYYFAGFIDLSLHNREGMTINDQIPLKIGVFINQQQKTQKVCEYLILNKPDDYLSIMRAVLAKRF